MDPEIRTTDNLAILMADDDPDDRLLFQQAFDAADICGQLIFVQDGEEALDYLNRRGDYADTTRWPRPACIVLDLNMPRKDGREVLAEIRTTPEFENLPVIVLTTSADVRDRRHCNRLDVCKFITKPNRFNQLIALMATIKSACAGGHTRTDPKKPVAPKARN